MKKTPPGPIFEGTKIGNVEFENRLIRSSIGGRYALWDGRVNKAWTNFEQRFAANGVGAIVSATFSVNPRRVAPLEYPNIASDDVLPDLQAAICRIRNTQSEIRPNGRCRYILQIGDPGYHTQASLFSERRDELAPSAGFDAIYGYRSFRSAMTIDEIEEAVDAFRQAAVRARKAGCDGIEVTASKGYLIHQFLNPAVNRRTDKYGGSLQGRFQFLKEVASAIRKAVGDDFLFGVRISANDFHYLPVLAFLRWPNILVHGLRDPAYWYGNSIEQMLKVGEWLTRKDCGAVNYLHVSNGFGFINPKENPGEFPLPEVRQFLNSTRHLSFKGRLRSTFFNTLPLWFWRLFTWDWKFVPEANLDDAVQFKKLGIPVIANGAFQNRISVERALYRGCDMVSMARPLLANPNLPELLYHGRDPDNPCTHCNRCTVMTTMYPLGCYDPSRFNGDDRAMERQILAWSKSPFGESATLPVPDLRS